MSDGIEEFGPYAVYERLGQGGMATVHRAEKRGVGFRRPVALKRLLPHVAADPDLVTLFVDEARLASHLHHANITQTYELGKVGEIFFIAMEYASGPTLTQIIRQCQKAAGEIPLTVTVNVLCQICEALDYAHNLCDEAGKSLRIVHRDVSPANIIVTNTGVVKLIDFGIAKTTMSSVKTQTGFIKGKFGYIAPEYITGRIDSRVDLFAVGVVAHEMLAGRRLFEGKDDFETLQNIRDMKMEPPSHWNPHVTPDLDDIVMTALARDPDRRWQSAAAMGVALVNAGRDLGIVVGSLQLVEWVEWAFSQVPGDAGGPVRRLGPEIDTLGPQLDSRAFMVETNVTAGDIEIDDDGGAGSSISIEMTDLPADAFASGVRRPASDADGAETLQLERVRLGTSDLEVLTPPALAAAVRQAHHRAAHDRAAHDRAADLRSEAQTALARRVAEAPGRERELEDPLAEPPPPTPRPVRTSGAQPRVQAPPGPPPVPVPPPLPPAARSGPSRALEASALPRASASPTRPPPLPRAPASSTQPPPLPTPAPSKTMSFDISLTPTPIPRPALPFSRSTPRPSAPELRVPELDEPELRMLDAMPVLPPTPPPAAPMPRLAEASMPLPVFAAASLPPTLEPIALPLVPASGRFTPEPVAAPPPVEARAAPRATKPTAPRRKRRTVRVILLLMVLGAGAMAVAYFWPDLEALIDQLRE